MKMDSSIKLSLDHLSLENCNSWTCFFCFSIDPLKGIAVSPPDINLVYGGVI